MSGDLAALIREFHADEPAAWNQETLAAFLSARGVVVLDRERTPRWLAEVISRPAAWQQDPAELADALIAALQDEATLKMSCGSCQRVGALKPHFVDVERDDGTRITGYALWLSEVRAALTGTDCICAPHLVAAGECICGHKYVVDSIRDGWNPAHPSPPPGAVDRLADPAVPDTRERLEARMDRCAECGHMPHVHACFNMASDNDCGCTYVTQPSPADEGSGRHALWELRKAAEHPHKGPNDTDASMLREAAKRVKQGYQPGGSHTSAMVVRVLTVLADLVERHDGLKP